MERMDGVQTRIGQLSSTIEQANIRVAVIGAACAELKASISDVDVSQIKLLYEEARLFIPNLQHTFEELVAFHNTMLEERVRFISADLPRLEASLRDMHKELENLLREERSLSDALSVDFDFAYTSFADSQGIECLHFLLYDKKEMMHGNQLSQIDEVARDCNVQVIVSILEDKLPDEMAEGNEVVLRLSQESKLFRIEELLERE